MSKNTAYLEEKELLQFPSTLTDEVLTFTDISVGHRNKVPEYRPDSRLVHTFSYGRDLSDPLAAASRLLHSLHL